MVDFRPESQNVYVLKWKGERTGWLYKLEVIQSGFSSLTAPVYIDLPPTCGVVKNLETTGFNKYPVGVPAGATMKVFWDINLIPTHSDFNALRSALLNPAITTTTSRPFTTGTIYKLYINPVGNYEDPGMNFYHPIFTGIQLEGIEANFDAELNQITVDVEDIHYYVPSNLGITEEFIDIDDFKTTIIKTIALYELVIKKTSPSAYNYGIGHCLSNDLVNDYWYCWQTLQKFWDRLTYHLQFYYRFVLRDYSFNLTIEKPLTRYYRQNYSGDGSLGAELTWDDIFLLFAVRHETELIDIGGLLNLDDDNSLPKRYKSYWDLLSDWFKESLTKAAFNSSSVVGAYPIYNDDQVIVLDRNKMNSCKPKFCTNISSKVTSSLSEIIDDDLDKFEAFVNRSRNNGEETLPIVFNNIPTASYYKDSQNGSWDGANMAIRFSIKNPSVLQVSDSSKQHISNLYYMFYDSDVVTTPMPIRVHEFVRTYLDTDTTTDELDDCEFNPFISDSQDATKPTELCLEAQSYCKPKIQAEAFLRLANNLAISEIEIEIFFNEYSHWTGGGDVGFVWWYDGIPLAFEFDMTSINPELNYIPKTWIWMNSKLDIQKEIATVKLQTKAL